MPRHFRTGSLVQSKAFTYYMDLGQSYTRCPPTTLEAASAPIMFA